MRRWAPGWNAATPGEIFPESDRRHDTHTGGSSVSLDCMSLSRPKLLGQDGRAVYSAQLTSSAVWPPAPRRSVSPGAPHGAPPWSPPMEPPAPRRSAAGDNDHAPFWQVLQGSVDPSMRAPPGAPHGAPPWSPPMEPPMRAPCEAASRSVSPSAPCEGEERTSRW